MKIKHTIDGRMAVARDKGQGIQGFTVRKVAEDKLERLKEEGYDGYIEEGRFPYTIFITKQPNK